MMRMNEESSVEQSLVLLNVIMLLFSALGTEIGSFQ